MTTGEKWGLALFISFATSVFVFLFMILYKDGKAASEQDKQQREACIKLDARYMAHYKVKGGPYQDVDMIAVEFHTYSIGLTPAYGNDLKIRQFLCADVYGMKDK